MENDNAYLKQECAAIGLANTCQREKISVVIRQKAEQLRREVDKLENLAKIMDILPNELENALYPIVIEYIYHGNSTSRIY